VIWEGVRPSCRDCRLLIRELENIVSPIARNIAPPSCWEKVTRELAMGRSRVWTAACAATNGNYIISARYLSIS